MRMWWSKLTRLLTRRKELAEELNEEIHAHLEFLVERNMERGMTPGEARAAAQRELGNTTLLQEHSYEAWQFGWLETLVQDIRYALRGFLRNPAFAVTAILTLALAIGATTAVFSVVDRILFRSLPYADDDRIVSVGLVQSLERQEFMLGSFFFDWRENQQPFESMAAQGTYPHACDLIENNPAQLGCVNVQRGFFPLLGISPVLGRNFLPEEDRPNGPAVAILSYSLWQGHYGGDPGILNRLINVDGSSVRIIGVLPKSFELPTLQTAEIFRPMGLNETQERAASPGSPMRVFARLRPGVTIAQAKNELEPLFLHTQQTVIPAEIRKDFHLSIRSVRDRETQDVQAMAWILLGSVLAVLLIACANLASLMMARGAARERELAMRAALGASRGRLVWQTLTEALLLSLGGAVVGLALAEVLLHLFLKMAPASIPFLQRAGLDFRIAVFTILLSLISGFLFGLLAALQKPGAIGFAAYVSRFGHRALLRRVLVAGQIAISMILLSAAGLLLKSFRNLEEQNLGMQTNGVLTARIALPQSHYNTGQKRMEFYLNAEAAMKRLPGLQAVGWSDSFPPGGWSGGRRFSDFFVEGKPAPTPGTGGGVVYRTVTPGYFRALGIPIVRGRGFTEEDRRDVSSYHPLANVPMIQGQRFAAETGEASEQKLVVSKLMAARLFPGENPIGQRIQMNGRGAWSTVAGVADNVKNSGLMEKDVPEVYVLRRNVPDDWGGLVALTGSAGGGGPVMVVKTELPSTTAIPWIRAQIAHLDPTVPVEVEHLTQSVNQLTERPRFQTALLGFFAVTGLAMAVIGLYGLISFMAAQRTKEIGVRIALGADRLSILRLIVWEGVRLIALGGIIGIAAALSLAKVFRSLLFHVGPYDPINFLVVGLLLALAATVATLLPAWAAMKTDPLVALRYE